MRKPIIMAHRGASAYAPENTLSAFRRALEMNAEGIELDVHLTKDLQPVVIHDPKVNRTSNGKGQIMDMTLEELKRLDFGSWFSSEFKNERIAVLDEVLSLLSSVRILLNIELKEGEGLEGIVASTLNRYPSVNNVIISSFNHGSLKEIKRIAPLLKTGLLCSSGHIISPEYCKSMNACAVHPHFNDINAANAKEYKKNNIMINVYTVDQPEAIKKAALDGVDSIITNVPDVALGVVNSL